MFHVNLVLVPHFWHYWVRLFVFSDRGGWMAPKNTGHCNLYMIRVFLMQQKFTFNIWYTYFCFVHVFTSGKQVFSPGWCRASVPVAQPGLTN
jgi:hypothetical protein